MTEPSWSGGSFGVAGRLRAGAEPSLMTLDGTNTWVLREPGAARSVVVDPGPLDAAHLDAVRAVAGDVAVVLLTHHHLDHSEGARAFAERGRVRRCGRSTRRTGSAPRGSATATSSRSTASRCTWSRRPGTPPTRCRFVLPAERAVLTGDTVLGRGTTVVAHPDGQLGAYLDSLRPAARPGRGAARSTRSGPATARCSPTPSAALDHYLAHRRQRLDQVREALRRCTPPRGTGHLDHEQLPRRRSSRSCTPTSTRSSGAPPSSPSAPSWPTCSVA